MQTKAVARPNKTAGLADFVLDRKSLGVNVLAGVALLVAMLVRVVFANASGPGWGNNISNLGSDIAIGYFAAWIVYYLTSWRPRRLDRNQALLTVGAAIIQVTGQAQGILNNLRKATGDTGSGPITQRDLDQLVRHLNLDSPVPSMLAKFRGPQATVLEMLQHFIART